ncbi:MAG: DNA methyltransferase, partial [Candidatus Saccharimonadales bacterium]
TKKQVVDPVRHKQLSAQYLKIINDLEARYPVQVDASFAKLVNFKTNKQLPIHGWFDYKQGYADQLVQRLITAADLRPGEYVLDPFTGVGTTQVSAQRMRVNSVGLDINPVASFAASVKTHHYTPVELRIIKQLLEAPADKYQLTKKTPAYKKLRDIFTQAQLQQVLTIKGFWEAIDDQSVQGFFRLAFLAIIEPVSNRVKDGNGIKIAHRKKPLEDVYAFYEAHCQRMLDDLNGQAASTPALVLDGSLLQDEISKQVARLPIGAVIYSPPYANCFDYLEVYKMEVWLGGFVDDYQDFSRYRQLAIRSHVNAAFSSEIKYPNPHVDTIAALIATHNIWNKHIPAMLRGYFDDMRGVMKRTYQVSRDGALCAIVVANSGYKGVIVPTDLLLTEIAEAVGYRLEKIIHARDIRASSQQMTELKSKHGLMRESIIVLRK